MKKLLYDAVESAPLKDGMFEYLFQEVDFENLLLFMINTICFCSGNVTETIKMSCLTHQ